MEQSNLVYQQLTEKQGAAVHTALAFLKNKPCAINKEIGTALFGWSCRVEYPALSKAAYLLWIDLVEGAAQVAALDIYKNHQKQPNNFYRLCQHVVDLPNYDVPTLQLFFDWRYDSKINLSGKTDQPLKKIPPLFSKANFCINIKEISIEYHYITNIPTDFFNLTQLKKLSFANGQLLSMPKAIQQLKHLAVLDLSHNDLSTLPKALSSLSTLVQLNIDGNPLKRLPLFLEKFGVFTRFFDAYQCGVPKGQEDIFVETFKGLPDHLSHQQMTTLFCAGGLHPDKTVRSEAKQQWLQRLPDGVAENLSYWVYRVKLDYIKFLLYFNEVQALVPLFDNDIVTGWLKSIGFRTRKKAALIDLNLEAIPDFYFKPWSTSRVDLSGNLFTQVPMQALLGIHKLVMLDMSHNLLESLSGQALQQLKELRELNLGHNFFSAVPVHLTELNKLESLDLSHNLLTELSSELPVLPKLQKLNLSFNELAKIPAEITQFTNLQELDLSYNFLGAIQNSDYTYSYALPLEISYLDALTHLYLSHNQLTQLPPGIGLIEMLKVLDCSHNQFVEIPCEVFEAETLEVLDFSYNKLEAIPEDIALLPQLKKVILTGNPLTTGAVKKARHWRKDVEWVYNQEPLEVNVPASVRRKPGEALLLSQGKSFYKEEKYDEATICYVQAAALGGYEGLNALGEINLYKKKDYQQALHWCSKAARLQSPEAMLYLGWMYYKGLGVAVNLTKATHWFEQSGALGLISGQYNAALMYHHGRGVKVNFSKAVFWYHQAAEQGHASAAANLGWMYADGKGVTINKSLAADYYRKAALKGQQDAQRNLAHLLRDGDGVDKNEAEAFNWYEKAASKGDASALVNLGWMYQKGKGCRQDYIKALKYYTEAANKGHSRAQYNTGVMYQLGKGTFRNLSEAFAWYKLAAEQGYANAQQRVAKMYATGLGVKRNKKLAEKWRDAYLKSVTDAKQKK
ncbi:leucine-rich repeat domain-containing protein [Microscilla marina]|uniref:Leucine Rich Repeat domain protein n=1 Tax=Microscilla marina ATCC 23134 TaxID=313606 RepID=A1ZJG9_MICM2|nr:leucine-rich repeat domain-containing protein [Microscilla marina]EAY29272.1 leucine Rich Repeat domain protein [Microscilla marina ATCC 23134]